MTAEEKAVDIHKQVAELEELPPGVRFDQRGVWVRIEMSMEKERSSKSTRWIIIVMVALLLITIAIAIMARLAFQQGDLLPAKEVPTTSGYISSVHQNQTI